MRLSDHKGSQHFWILGYTSHRVMQKLSCHAQRALVLAIGIGTSRNLVTIILAVQPCRKLQPPLRHRSIWGVALRGRKTLHIPPQFRGLGCVLQYKFLAVQHSCGELVGEGLLINAAPCTSMLIRLLTGQPHESQVCTTHSITTDHNL